MKYSFNDICRMITGTDANDICTPEKESDWLSIAKHIIAGFGIITNKRPDNALLIYDSTLDNLEALYEFITKESVNDYLLDDEKERQMMNRTYAHFAKAVAKAYICQNAERDGKKPIGKFLGENRLETFGQFLFRKAGDFVQIED